MRDTRLVEALLRPEAYPGRPDSVELIETHISLVFLAGDRVYKVKKDVRMGFVDGRGLERRRHLCDEEVRLNAALAPGVYLGTVAIAGHPPRIGGEGPVLEYAVEMVRLPESGMLDRLLAQDGPDEAAIRRIARRLRRFHERARVVGDDEEHGTPERIGQILRAVRDRGRAAVPAVLLDRIAGLQDGFLQAQRALLLSRKRAGWIREGHGDLHAGNVCFVDDRIVIYDRIEFSARIRCCDVANDLAFLAMDLDRYGALRRSAALVEEYGPAAQKSLVEFYKVHRAAVRGTVGLMRGDVADAARYYQLACGYALPAALVLTCGLPGSGKSTLSRHLAAPLRAAVLRSDVVRKRLAKIPATERWKGGFLDGPYTPEMTERTYGNSNKFQQVAIIFCARNQPMRVIGCALPVKVTEPRLFRQVRGIDTPEVGPFPREE